MSRHFSRDEMDLYLRDNLDEPDKRELEEHLETCLSCFAALEGVADLGAIPANPAGPDPLPDGLAQRLETIPPPKRPVAPPPSLIDYEILGLLGQGGMGVVYKARHRALDRVVALKMIRDSAFAKRLDRIRFRREAEVVARLQHPNIVQIHEIGETKECHPYFALEYVEGGNLTDKLNGKPLPPREAAELVKALARAMQLAHSRNVVHRDLKPANVLIATDGTPKVADFGLARQLDSDSGETQEGTGVMGTPSYMAPEQASGRTHEAGPAADTYALGAILYECLAGRPPFKESTVAETCYQVQTQEPKPPSHWQAKVPVDLETICLKCLQKMPEKRYPSAAELADDLDRFLNGEPIVARPVGRLERTHMWVLRNPTRTALLITLFLLAVGGILYTIEKYDRAIDDALRGAEAERKKALTDRSVTDALARTNQLTAQAKNMPLSTSKEAKEAVTLLKQAADALAQADAALNTGVADDGMTQRATEAREQLEEARLTAENALAQTLRKEKLFRDLDDARMAAVKWVRTDFDYPGAALKYAAAFAALGLEVQPDQTDVVAQRIRAEEPAVRDALNGALDHWAFCVKRTALEADLLAIARAADQDAWRRDYRQAVVDRDGAALVRLSKGARGLALPPASFELLANALIGNDQRTEALDLLRWARLRHPTDFWITLDLGNYLLKAKAVGPAELEERIGCYYQAVALRPNASAAHNNLGFALADKNLLGDAVTEFKKAIEIDPESADAHNNLAKALHDKSQLDDAIGEWRLAIKLNPILAPAHNGLGSALSDKGQLDDAIVEYRTAIALNRKDPLPHNNLGNTLQLKGLLDDAIAEYDEAVALDPKFAEPYYNRGNALRARGRFAQAEASFQRFLELHPANDPLREATDRLMKQARRFAVLDSKLHSFISGKAKPTDAAESLDLAALCHIKEFNLAATRFVKLALADQPALADDLGKSVRYDGACYAALAAAGNGKDVGKLSDQERAGLRKQALQWLQADLAVWSKLLDNEPNKLRPVVQGQMIHWKRDNDLAGIRDPAALKNLSPDERDTCLTLWANVNSLLK